MKLQHTLAALDSKLSVESQAHHFSKPTLIEFNQELADQLGLELHEATQEELAQIFSGQKRLDEMTAPRSFVYAGHQFGHFNPQLGDGRAMLLGEVLKDQTLYDIQLKGSGRTVFSRRGDGLSALGPVLREMILCEYMHKLEVPTTRGLCAVLTGDQVIRQEVVPGGVFTRVARGHVRIGSFEFFASRQDSEMVNKLVDYSLERFYPEVQDVENKALALFDHFSKRTLDLVATWMSYGFIHGVMNTDNMNISGETIDYGPCAFLDEYKSDKVFSSIDQQGRYRYNLQGKIALWNLSAFAQCLVPLIDPNAQSAVEIFQQRFIELEKYFEEKRYQKLAAKFGLKSFDHDDQKIMDQFLADCEKHELDFTLVFSSLCSFWQDKQISDELKLLPFFYDYKNKHSALFANDPSCLERMKKANPMLIARNHQIEEAIEQANQGDLSYYHKVRQALKNPFEIDDQNRFMQNPPSTDQRVQQTFCGT